MKIFGAVSFLDYPVHPLLLLNLALLFNFFAKLTEESNRILGFVSQAETSPLEPFWTFQTKPDIRSPPAPLSAKLSLSTILPYLCYFHYSISI